jgi:glycosyltransferase involved in cell wall biosynthesis
LGGFDSPFLLAPQEVPLSVTFYDLIPIVKREMHFDCWEPWRKKTYSRRIEQLLASNAQVLAISECTRQDLHRFTSYPLGGITTIMAGVNRAETQPSEARVRQVLERFGLTSPFFMSVGGLDGHKGFVATANAYVSVVGARKVQFAVVGSFNDPNKENFRKAFDANKIPGVVFTGYLNREEMACIYAASHGLIFPSHYEGFGFPVLEAMAHGCPAITTNVSSLPEVAGDAGLLVPVDSPPAIAEAMRRLLDEPGLRGEMSRKGLAQAQNFSWQKSAGITLEVWENLLREPEIHRGRRSIEAVRM